MRLLLFDLFICYRVLLRTYLLIVFIVKLKTLQGYARELTLQKHLSRLKLKDQLMLSNIMMNLIDYNNAQRVVL